MPSPLLRGEAGEEAEEAEAESLSSEVGDLSLRCCCCCCELLLLPSLSIAAATGESLLLTCSSSTSSSMSSSAPLSTEKEAASLDFFSLAASSSVVAVVGWRSEEAELAVVAPVLASEEEAVETALAAAEDRCEEWDSMELCVPERSLPEVAAEEAEQLPVPLLLATSVLNFAAALESSEDGLLLESAAVASQWYDFSSPSSVFSSEAFFSGTEAAVAMCSVQDSKGAISTVTLESAAPDSSDFC